MLSVGPNRSKEKFLNKPLLWVDRAVSYYKFGTDHSWDRTLWALSFVRHKESHVVAIKAIAVVLVLSILIYVFRYEESVSRLKKYQGVPFATAFCAESSWWCLRLWGLVIRMYVL